MRRIALLTLIVSVLACAAPEDHASTAAGGRRQPKDLEGAFLALDSILPDSTRRRIRDFPAESLWVYHMGLAMWMRNSWGLWSGSDLQRDLRRRGVKHPDDMSSLILSSYRHRLRGEPLGIEEAVRDFDEFWQVTAEPTDLRVAGCRAPVEIRGSMNAEPPPARKYRQIHLATCPDTRAWWAYEYDRGWYPADSAAVRRFTTSF
jgi:hypothetical protein